MPYQLTVQRNPSTLNVKDLGAVGDGAHDDTASINAALSMAHMLGGGTVTTSPGASHLISAPLVIYSNIKLLFDASNTITLAANSNCNMIKNFSTTPQRTVSDAAITINTTTLTSATANFTSADVGRTVVVANAFGSSTFPLVASITTINSTSSVTVSVAALATVSGASCSIYTRDSNIEVSGGYWQRGANGYPGGVTSGVQYQTTLFRHLDNASMHDMTLACSNNGYQLSFGDVTNIKVRNITLVTPNTVRNTDGVTFTGPAQYIEVDGVYGTTGDDFFSAHCVDGDANLQDVCGDIKDMVVQNLYPSNVGQGAVKLSSRAGPIMRSVIVRGVHGSAAFGVNITSGTNPSTFNVDNLVIDDINCVCTTANPLVQIYTNNATGMITLSNVVWRTNPGGTIHIIDFQANSTLGTLLIDGFEIGATSSPFGLIVSGTLTHGIMRNIIKPDNTQSISAVCQINSTGVLSTLVFDTLRLAFTTNAVNTILANIGSVKVAEFNNVYLSNGGIPVKQQNSGLSNIQVIMNNVTLDSAYQLAQVLASSTADFSISNLNVLTTNQSALIALVGTGANMSLRGKGLINPNAKTAFSRDGTQSPRINHSEMLADISLLTPGDQDMVNNNNSGLSSGAGICIFHTGGTGNGWKNVYSGSTY